MCMLKGDKGNEDQAPQSTLWLLLSFVFTVMWSVASTITQESRVKFDAFYRVLLAGKDPDYPPPKTFKLNKNQLFPEKGTCFDYICDKMNNQWVFWLDILDRERMKIQPDAKVMGSKDEESFTGPVFFVTFLGVRLDNSYG